MKKEKDGTDIVGNLIKAKTAKSRLSKENKDVTVRLYYDEARAQIREIKFEHHQTIKV